MTELASLKAELEEKKQELAARDDRMRESFRRMRTMVGVLAVLLPLVLGLSSLFSSIEFVPSISEYFYTPMREFLVGTIGAISIFLFNYRGYPVNKERALSDWKERVFTDRRVALAAAIGALFVAFFPSRTDINMLLEPEPIAHGLLGEGIAGILHSAGALVFFLALAVFCAVNFRRIKNPDNPTPTEQLEDSFYLGCARVLGLCILLLVANFMINSFDALCDLAALLQDIRLVYWVEAVGLLVFSMGWLVKGRAITTTKRLIREIRQGE